MFHTGKIFLQMMLQFMPKKWCYLSTLKQCKCNTTKLFPPAYKYTCYTQNFPPVEHYLFTAWYILMLVAQYDSMCLSSHLEYIYHFVACVCGI